jgi:hypothetical protein
MSYAVVYVMARFLYRIVDFFNHWYIGASRSFLHSFFSVLESLDETFAVHITLRHFFEPLYGDYSIVGRILGIVFRSGRVLVGSVIYLILGLIFIATYALWLAIPILLILFVIRRSAGNVNFLPY